MDFLSNANVVPAAFSLLDPTNPLHNVTLLQNTFMGAFLGTFIANVGFQTVRHIFGESDYFIIPSTRVYCFIFSNISIHH